MEFNFRDYKSIKEFFKDIYYKKFSIKEAESMQEEFSVVLTALEKYKTRDSEYNNKTLKLLENLKRFYDEREMIINAFKNKIFHFTMKKTCFGMKMKMILWMKMVLLIIKSLRLIASKERT